MLQHPRLAAALLPPPSTVVPAGPIDETIAFLERFAHHGTFGPGDLLATALGGLAALALGTRLLAVGQRR